MSKLSFAAALIAVAVVTQAAPAAAQEVNPLVRERIGISPDQRALPVRVQVNINFFMAGPSDDSEDANKLRERARLNVYEMANHECALLEQVMAKTCRLEAISVNINRQQAFGQGAGLNAAGNFSLQITPK